MLNPSIVTSIFRSLGIDPMQFKTTWEGFIDKISDFEILLQHQTDAINNLSDEVARLRLKIDPDAVGETPIGGVIATYLEQQNGQEKTE